MAHDVSPWLDLPAQPRVVFERTPLALVICQVRFSTMLAVNDPASMAPFQAAIQGEYPLASPVVQQRIGLSVGPEGAQFALPPQPVPTPVWKFSDLADDWSFVLTSDAITLETRAYEDFDDFVARLRRVLEALESAIRPTVCTRIGLRYINELRPEHQDWGGTINSELLGPLANPEVAEHVVQATQQILLNGPDGERIHLQHGLVPKGTTVELKPGVVPSEDPFYLLDVDAFREFARPDLVPVDLGKIYDLVDSLHIRTSQLFRWAITETFAATMGERSLVSH